MVSLRYDTVEVKLHTNLKEITLFWPSINLSLDPLVLFSFGRLGDHVVISVVPNCNFLHRFGHHSNLHLDGIVNSL